MEQPGLMERPEQTARTVPMEQNLLKNLALVRMVRQQTIQFRR
jgi:hypothetical protein